MRVGRLATGVFVSMMMLPMAGCSDSDKAAISRDEFVTKATEICGAANKSIRESEAAWLADDDQTIDEAKQFYSTVARESADALEEISALGFPDADEAALSAKLDKATSALGSVDAELAKYTTLAQLQTDLEFSSGSKLAQLLQDADAEISAFSEYGPDICTPDTAS